MYLLQSLSIGVFAWVATGVLFQAGHLFYWYWKILDKWHNNLPRKWAWIPKPLGWCGYCFSGQLGLWFFALAAHYPISTFAPQYYFADNAIFALQSILFWAVCNGVDNVVKHYLK